MCLNSMKRQMGSMDSPNSVGNQELCEIDSKVKRSSRLTTQSPNPLFRVKLIIVPEFTQRKN